MFMYRIEIKRKQHFLLPQTHFVLLLKAVTLFTYQIQGMQELAPLLFIGKFVNFMSKIDQKMVNNVLAPHFLSNTGWHPSFSKCLDPPTRLTVTAI